MSDISCCGTECSTCYCYANMCNGCNECKGKVFHAPKGESCAIYECAVNQKHLNNCGECEEVPCIIWTNTRDPKFSDEEFEKNIAIRIQTLKKNFRGVSVLNNNDI